MLKTLLSNPPASEWKDAMISDRPICVAGAGSIGCFVGGMYAAAGRRVALLARPRVIGEIEAHGLQLTGFDGLERRIAADALSVPGLKMRPSPDIAGVQWGKLLVNLGNALNALSGLPLRPQLARRAGRRLFADQMAEVLGVIRAEGIRRLRCSQ